MKRKIITIITILVLLLTLGGCYKIPTASQNPNQSPNLTYNHDIRQITYSYQSQKTLKAIDFYYSDVHHLSLYQNGQIVSEISFDINNKDNQYYLEINYLNHRIIYDIVLDYSNVVALIDHQSKVIGYVFKDGNHVKKSDLDAIICDDNISWYLDSDCQNLADLTSFNGNYLYISGLVSNNNDWIRIDFDTNGGTFVNYLYINRNTCIINLPDTSKAGHSFVGWSSNGVIIDESYQFSSNVLLVANWQVNNYQVTLDANNGTENSNYLVSYQQRLDLSNYVEPTKSGFSFAGWYLEDQLVDLTDLVVTNNLSLIAKWQINEYQVFFVVDQLDYKVKTVYYNHNLSSVAAPLKTGYSFLGWSVTKDGNDFYNFNTPITNNLVLHAKYQINTFTVSFVSDDEILDSQTGQYGQTIRYQNEIPQKDGYRFVGWTDGLEQVIYPNDILVNSDLILYAKFVTNQFVVNFDANGGTNVAYQLVNYLAYAYYPDVPQHLGYEFLGWYLDGVIYDFNQTVTSDLTLVAHWKEIPSNNHWVTIYFDQREIYQQYLVADGQTLLNPGELHRLGYTFCGWYIDGVEYDFDLPVNKDLDIYPKWEIKHFTVSIVYNNGEPIVSEEYLFLDDIPYLEEPTYDGYLFGGWYVNGKICYFPYYVVGDAIIEAKWVLKNYLVSFYPGHGLSSVHQIVPHNGFAVEPILSGLLGHTFEGWYFEYELYDFNMPVTKSVILYAIWEPVFYSVSLDFGGLKENYTIDNVYYIESIYVADPWVDGYEFLGWYVNDQLVNLKDYPVMNNIHAVARWKVIKYVVTFDFNGLDYPPLTQEVTAFNRCYPPSPIIPGYIIDGWMYLGEEFDVDNITIASDLTLFAIWHEVEFYLIFDNLAGDISHVPFTVSTGVDGSLFDNNPNRPIGQSTGDFIGWFDINNNKVTEIKPGIAKNVYLSAKWSSAFVFELVNIDGVSGYSVVGFDQQLIENDIVYLPQIHDGMPVIGVGERLFANQTWIKEVVLPNGLLSIGNFAFDGTKINSINLPEGLLSIGNSAFANSELITVTIPSSITILNESVFKMCLKLESVYFNEGLKSIRSDAFNSCIMLDGVIFPQSLVEIGDGAFNSCASLGRIEIPSNVLTIDRFAFSYCLNLTEVVFNEGLKEIGFMVFSNCGSLLYAILPSSLESLGPAVFEECHSLVEAFIPDGIKVIGSRTFMRCYDLKILRLPVNLELIEYNAFLSCRSLETVIMPDSLIAIGHQAFSGCSSLVTVILNEGLELIDNFVFENCESIKEIYIPKSVSLLGCGAFFGCSSLEIAVVDGKFSVLFDEMFASCTSLEEVRILAPVTTTWGGVFSRCESLKTVVLPDTLVKIDFFFFNGCTSLESIVIPASLTIIGEMAFNGCINLREIIFEHQLADIPTGVSYDLDGLVDTKFYFKDSEVLDAIKQKIIEFNPSLAGNEFLLI